jgi:hypothetical protein
MTFRISNNQMESERIPVTAMNLFFSRGEKAPASGPKAAFSLTK